MATRMAQVPLQICEICERSVGRRYCIDCEQYFCKTCEEFHLKSKSCRDHVFQDIGHINPIDRKVKCKEHKENMTYYCTTCSMLVCKICLPTNHNKHDFSLTSEAAFTFKSELKSEIKYTAAVVETIKQQKLKLESDANQLKRLNQEVEQDISRKGNELKNLVDKVVNSSIATVKGEERKDLQKKTEIENTLHVAQKKAELLISKLTNAVENREDSVLLNSRHTLLQTIQSIPRYLESDMEWSTVRFKEGTLCEEMVTDMIGGVMISKKRAEQGKQNIQKANLEKGIAQWYFMEDNNGKTELKEYPDDITVILETALMKQQPQASFLDIDGNKYIVDFNSYEEYPADDPTDTIKVLRKSKHFDKTFEPPATWTHMDEKENLKVVPLGCTDQEYKDVVKKFTDTARGVKVKFVKIERVQNKTLYQQYIAKKKSVDATNKPGNKNERYLWHGFSKDAMDSINTYGFNRSYCGKNLTAFGLGVYFAVESAYSVQDTYSVPDKDANKHKRMYLCRVLVGEYAVGNKDTKVPPPKAAGSHILYDTVTNNVANPAMFIIFHDSQAFPEYLVTFKRL